MSETLLKHREAERQALIDRGGPTTPLKKLTVWTSTRRRTVETAQFLYEWGYGVRQRPQMSQLNPGVCEKMSQRRIREEFPEEVARHEADPYHHRFPRAEVKLSRSTKPDTLLIFIDSRTTIWPFDLSQSSSNWNESKMICLSLPTKASSGFSTGISWLATLPIFLRCLFQETKSSRSFLLATIMKLPASSYQI